MFRGCLLAWLSCLACLVGACPAIRSAEAPPVKLAQTFEETDLSGIDLSPTEYMLATWNWPGNGQPCRVVLWDLASGKELRVLTRHIKDVHGAAFSPDGKRFAACTSEAEGKAIYVWDVKTGRLQFQLTEENGSYFCAVTFSPDGKSLVTGDREGQVRIWNLETRQVVASQKCEAKINPSGTVVFSRDGRFLAAGCEDGSVWVWDEEGKGKGRKLSAHTEVVWAGSVAFSPDSKRLVSCSHDGTFAIWNTEDWKMVKTVRTGLRRVFCLALSPDGKTLVVGGDISVPPDTPPEKRGAIDIGYVELYGTEKFDKIGRVTLNSLPVFSLVVSRDGKFLATAGHNSFAPFPLKSTARIWKMEDLMLRAQRQ